MARKHPRHPDTKRDPGRVPARAERMDAPELMALIRQVNPTDRGLPAAERKQRYLEKSSLQSLLIRRFSEDLIVEPDSKDAELVLIRHRGLSVQGGHAVISELDDDAASWVRMQLDLGAQEDPQQEDISSAAGSGPDERFEAEDDTADGKLREGASALEQYDFDRARAIFLQAFELSQGGAAAAEALLELLVDRLGSDQQAVELVPELSSEAQDDPTVRTLLAQASVRLGDLQGAMKWVRGVTLARAADIIGEAAVAAAERDQRDLAESALVQLRLRDPVHPSIVLGRQILQTRRSLERAPAEAEILHQLEVGAWDDAQQCSRSLLALHPDSEVARQALLRIERRHRSERARERLQMATQKTIESEYEQIADLAREVLASGCDDETVLVEARRLLESAVERSREVKTARQVQDVAERLSREVSERAAMAYLALPLEARNAVRERTNLQVLGWLEQATAGRSSSQSRCVQAVLAFAEWSQRFDDDPEAFVVAIAPHEPLLSRVDGASALLARGRRIVADRRAARSRERVVTARQLLGDGKVEEAQQVFEAVEPGCLAPDERVGLESLQRAISSARNLVEAERRYEQERNPFRALALARQMADSAEGGDARKCWLERARASKQRLDDSWRVVRFDGEDAGSVESFVDHSSVDEHTVRCLRTDCATAVLGRSVGKWVFAAEVSLETRSAVRGIAFRMPQPPDRIEPVVIGQELWLLGAGGCAVQLDLGSWELRGWWEVRELNPGTDIPEKITLLPGAQTIAMEASTLKDRVPVLKLINLRNSEARRTLPGFGPVRPVVGAIPPVALVGRRSFTVTLMDGRGGTVSGRSLPTIDYPYCVAVAPDRAGFAVAASGEEDPETAPLVQLHVVDPSGRQIQQLEIDGPSIEAGVTLATSLREGMLFCLLAAGSEEPPLIAYRWEHGCLCESYRSAVVRGTFFLQDEDSQRVVAVSRMGADVQFTPLGPKPPAISGGGSMPWIPLPHLGPSLLPCRADDGAANSRALALTEQLSRMALPHQNRRIRELRGRRDDVAALQDLHGALGYLGRFQEAQELLAWLLVDRADDPLVRLMKADDHAKRADWGGVREALESIEESWIPSEDVRHYHHRLGMALAYAGEHDRALEHFLRGEKCEGACLLQPWIEVSQLPPDPMPDSWPGQEASLMLQVVAAIWRTYACLEADDLDGALAAIDRPVVRAIDEVQSAAWLAKVYLVRARAGRNDRVRSRIGVARFLGEYHQDSLHRQPMALRAPIYWSQERMEALAHEAEAWLEDWAKSQGTPRSR